jgi:hypothetical protein
MRVTNKSKSKSIHRKNNCSTSLTFKFVPTHAIFYSSSSWAESYSFNLSILTHRRLSSVTSSSITYLALSQFMDKLQHWIQFCHSLALLILHECKDHDRNVLLVIKFFKMWIDMKITKNQYWWFSMLIQNLKDLNLFPTCSFIPWVCTKYPMFNRNCPVRGIIQYYVILCFIFTFFLS